MTRVLIAGVSTRGFAESAARAGYEVVAVDGFGDLDLRARCQEVVVARTAQGRFSCDLAVQQARPLACDAVAYVASFENHPQALRALARDRALWGNPPAVVARARDPLRALEQLNPRAFPRTLPASAAADERAVRWLVKPRASGGGTGIRIYQAGAPVPKGMYLQEWLPGVAGSVVFAAGGGQRGEGRSVPLGISRMLVGDPAFGAEGFRYCGSILVAEGDWPEARRLANAAAAAFDLAGVNGVDFISVRGRGWCPIEVNPRYTASMELVERAHGISIFETHAQACAGELPRFDSAAARRPGGGGAGAALGKAIVYARGDVQVGDTAPWLEDEDIRDVPPPGERIARGQPVCSVFARGKDQQSCYAGLVKRAEWIYHALEATAVGSL
jgi:predicted ATP-grasp superfamily ATP-dependent carboligase